MICAVCECFVYSKAEQGNLLLAEEIHTQIHFVNPHQNTLGKPEKKQIVNILSKGKEFCSAVGKRCAALPLVAPSQQAALSQLLGNPRLKPSTECRLCFALGTATSLRSCQKVVRRRVPQHALKNMADQRPVSQMVKLGTFFFLQKQHFLPVRHNPHSSMFLLSTTAVGSWEIHSSDNLTSYPGHC